MTAPLDELIRARYGRSHPAAEEPALAVAAAGLSRFEPGRVRPRGGLAIDGVPIALADFDRQLAARIDAPLRRWPGGAEAAVIVTHDVDAFDGLSHFPLRLAGWAATAARAALRRDRATVERTARRARAWIGHRRRGEDPVADFERWMALEDRHGLRSTFFFLALDRALSREGRMYRVADPRVRAVLRALVAGGWQVGLHAARYGSETAAGLGEQRRRLEDAVGAPVRAVRHHYLTARFPAGWRTMRAAGFSISSNVGFHPPGQGFRTGTAWPHRPIGAAGPWEVPIAVMDAAHGPVPGALGAVFDALLAETRAVGGALVLDFHTNYRAEVDAPGVHAAFEQIVGRIAAAVARGEVAALTLEAAVDHVAAGLDGGALGRGAAV